MGAVVRNMQLEIKIINWYLPRARQGSNLAGVLADQGHSVTLYQMNDHQNPQAATKYKSVCIDIPRFLKGRSPFSQIPFVKGGLRRVQFLLKPLKGPCDVVIAMGYEVLSTASLIAKRLHRALLVYYPLECNDDQAVRRREQELCTKHVDIMINVEENRLALLKTAIKRDIHSFIVPNAPRKGIGVEPRGQLKAFLLQKYGIGSDARLVLFSGVYHPYANLEQLVSWSAKWDNRVFLVLILTGPIPEPFKSLININSDRVKIVPSVSPENLYEFIRDADIGLLPYEDDRSENVKFCSPQKMFDYLACGVPFVGSQRPIIQAVAESTCGGVCVNMKNEEQLYNVIHELCFNPVSLRTLSENGRKAYVEYWNYDQLVSPVIEALTRMRHRMISRL